MTMTAEEKNGIDGRVLQAIRSGSNRARTIIVAIGESPGPFARVLDKSLQRLRARKEAEYRGPKIGWVANP